MNLKPLADRVVLKRTEAEEKTKSGIFLAPAAQDIRHLDLQNCAVAIGSEGRGLSRELLDLCDGELIIPMRPGCESLNAAVAAAIVMWELQRDRLG